MKTISMPIKVLIAFIIFFILSFALSNIVESELLATAIFVFGLFLAFTFDNRKKRLDTIKESLRKQDSLILDVDSMSKRLGEKRHTEIKEWIDRLLMIQLDYKLQDIGNSTKHLAAFIDYIQDLKLDNDDQEDVRDDILEKLYEIRQIVKEVTYNVGNRMSSLEWSALILLYLIVIFLIFQEKIIDSLLSKFLISLLLSSFTFFMFILREFDILRWQEKDWIWKPLENLFNELGLIPYVPEAIFIQKRAEIKDYAHSKCIRVGKFKHPYPDMKEKEIVTIHLD